MIASMAFTRSYHRWFSASLQRDMELLVFGHAGARVVLSRLYWIGAFPLVGVLEQDPILGFSRFPENGFPACQPELRLIL